MAPEPIHQLADSDPKRLRTKCGLDIDRKYDKRSRVTIWWRDVTCTDCEPKDLPENRSG
jgi:hypothetical protein